jgi:hypothetical protein
MTPKERMTEGQRVRIDYRNVFGAGQDKNWKMGIVEDMLAGQFTAVVQDPEYGEQTVFRAYQDIGNTWEFYPDE